MIQKLGETSDQLYILKKQFIIDQTTQPTNNWIEKIKTYLAKRLNNPSYSHKRDFIRARYLITCKIERIHLINQF
jgi:hypothetical protein